MVFRCLWCCGWFARLFSHTTMSQQDTTMDDLRQRIESLETEQDRLRERIDSLEGDGPDTSGKRDRYDAYVLDEMVEGSTYGYSAIRNMYEVAGVRDNTKIKSRIKHLTRAGVLTNTGMGTWRFNGAD